jgi:hypothetical protein
MFFGSFDSMTVYCRYYHAKNLTRLSRQPRMYYTKRWRSDLLM